MAKRKRTTGNDQTQAKVLSKRKIDSEAQILEQIQDDKPEVVRSVQIITGSYDRVLHGFVATLSLKGVTKNLTYTKPSFSDNFLFNAHASAIRCLALSPISTDQGSPNHQKIILASGGTDEKINLYSLSTSIPSKSNLVKALPLKSSVKSSLAENKNKELGSLLHHASNINVLCFPTRSKLLSGSNDNTIAVARTRDWTVLSTLKAPVPRAVGRPSGDTAPPGETPAGINDFAVHPSMKLMISVGKGERCMRLWNLVTGKKAGVLNFERSLLESVKESKFSSGEGRKVVWNARGDRFVIAFDRGAVLFGMDSKAIGRILAKPTTKLHQMHYIPLTNGSEIFAVSTEDGRLLFFQLKDEVSNHAPHSSIEVHPAFEAFAFLGGKASGMDSRIKDFKVLLHDGGSSPYLIVTASSDGTVRLWEVDVPDLHDSRPKEHSSDRLKGEKSSNIDEQMNNTDPKHVGRLLGSYSTENRITCLEAFWMFNPINTASVDISTEDKFSESDFEGID